MLLTKPELLLEAGALFSKDQFRFQVSCANLSVESPLLFPASRGRRSRILYLDARRSQRWNCANRVNLAQLFSWGVVKFGTFDTIFSSAGRAPSRRSLSSVFAFA